MNSDLEFELNYLKDIEKPSFKTKVNDMNPDENRLQHYKRVFTDPNLSIPYDNAKKTIVSKVKKMYPLELEGKKFLDVGCGNGWACVEFAKQGCFVTGIDLNEIDLKMARARAKFENQKIDFLKASAEKLPFKDNLFDLTFSIYVLEHCNMRKAISEMIRVTKKGGYCYFKVPNKYSFLNLRHKHSKDEIVEEPSYFALLKILKNQDNIKFKFESGLLAMFRPTLTVMIHKV